MITIKVKHVKSFWERANGLIGKKPEALFFKTRMGIHTFGMSYPIDVLILDQKGFVKKLKKNLLPNRLFFWNPRFNLVVELPPGTIAKKEIKPGNRIKI